MVVVIVVLDLHETCNSSAFFYTLINIAMGTLFFTAVRAVLCRTGAASVSLAYLLQK